MLLPLPLGRPSPHTSEALVGQRVRQALRLDEADPADGPKGANGVPVTSHRTAEYELELRVLTASGVGHPRWAAEQFLEGARLPRPWDLAADCADVEGHGGRSLGDRVPFSRHLRPPPGIGS